MTPELCCSFLISTKRASQVFSFKITNFALPDISKFSISIFILGIASQKYGINLVFLLRNGDSEKVFLNFLNSKANAKQTQDLFFMKVIYAIFFIV